LLITRTPEQENRLPTQMLRRRLKRTRKREPKEKLDSRITSKLRL